MMIKKLLSGFALALACMGSSHADLLLTQADTPLTFNVGSLSHSNFVGLEAQVQGASFSTNYIASMTVFTGLGGTDTQLFSTVFDQFSQYTGFLWSNPNVAELVDGFSIVLEILSGTMTVLAPPGETEPTVSFTTRTACVGKDCSPPSVDQGLLTPVRRALTNNVPEPGTLLLLAIGAVAFAAVRQRPA